jgi:hypothetical protein
MGFSDLPRGTLYGMYIPLSKRFIPPIIDMEIYGISMNIPFVYGIVMDYD